MSEVHERIGSIAEKLEFSNALRKQLERELKAERIEHGKTKAYAMELEHRIEGLYKVINGPIKSLTKEDLIEIKTRQLVAGYVGEAKGSRLRLEEQIKINAKLIADVASLKRALQSTEARDRDSSEEPAAR